MELLAMSCVRNAGLVELALGCGTSLKALGIAACAKITDVSLEAVGVHCKSLETLSLDSEFMHNKGVLAVAQGCPFLKVLKLQCINVTDEALKAVGTSCAPLELLALYSFQRFTDKFIFQFFYWLPLNVIGYLSQRANQTGKLFLNSTEQGSCLVLLTRFRGNISGCGIEKLVSGNGGCSDYSLDDVTNKLGDRVHGFGVDYW
ncbi:F-box/LRR-repeat protein 4-like [Humulus lupulus]|uniref:F-box/LRR-repeat protein 4-like n=1 Tax=Humulus lupulus TaxID=3486 RepID=UPI002B417A1C|nr:F-box/LRR-repeat protein 4-like [Humulus lupulus]